MKFKNYNGRDVSLEEITALISSDGSHQLYVGTDSQVHKGKGVVYATCVVLYKKGKGGKIFVSKETEGFAHNLHERLMNETWRSLSTAFKLTEIVSDSTEIVIHVDVNKSHKFKSGDYNQELVALVMGQGYKCTIKPDAWAAQCVADHFTK